MFPAASAAEDVPEFVFGCLSLTQGLVFDTAERTVTHGRLFVEYGPAKLLRESGTRRVISALDGRPVGSLGLSCRVKHQSREGSNVGGLCILKGYAVMPSMTTSQAVLRAPRTRRHRAGHSVPWRLTGRALVALRGAPWTVRIFTSAILLVAGDKSGQWDKWYRTAIPRAERLYDDYLAERRKETGP